MSLLILFAGGPATPIGTVSTTLEAATSTASGDSGAAGTSAATLGAATSTASGSHTQPTNGTIAATLGAAAGSPGTAVGGLDGNNDSLYQTTEVAASLLTAWSATGVFKRTTNSDTGVIAAMRAANSYNRAHVTTAGMVRVGSNIGGVDVVSINLNEWYFFGITQTGATRQITAYIKPVAGGSVSQATTTSINDAAACNGFWVAADLDFGLQIRSMASEYRLWTGRTLTQAEVEAEWASARTPVNTTNLVGHYPLIDADTKFDALVGGDLISKGAGSWTTETGPFPGGVATGAVGAAGSGATTLSAATSSATATHPRFGEVASTLGAATLAASGTADSPSVTGTIASTLDAATLAAAGVRGASGLAASTLGAATIAVTGAHGVAGLAASTLGAATSSGVATHGNAGTAASTLEAATSSGTATHPRFGTVASTLADASLSASGSVGGATVFGTVSTTLSAATLDALGSTVTGSVSSALGAAVSSATGTHGVAGQAASTLVSAALTAAGAHGVSGQAASTLVSAALDATGSHNQSASGTISSTLVGASLASTGARGAAGVAASTLDAASVSATGRAAVIGQSAATLSPAVVASTGARGATGLASSSLVAATLSAEGVSFGVVTAVVAATLAPASVVAFGILGELPFVMSTGRTGYVVQILGGPQRVQEDDAQTRATFDNETTAVLDEVTNECQFENG